MSKSTKSLSYLTSTLSISSLARANSAASSSTHVIRTSIGRGRRSVSGLSATRGDEQRRREEGRLGLVANRGGRSAYGGSGNGGGGGPRTTTGSSTTPGGSTPFFEPSLGASSTKSSATATARLFHTSPHQQLQLGIGISSTATTTTGGTSSSSATPNDFPPPPRSPPSPTPTKSSPLPSQQESSASSSLTSNPSTTKGGDKPLPNPILLHSNPAATYPNQNLPAFFGTRLDVARRSNLVFRNGAYGIPKASLGDHVRGGKGKEKVVELEAEREIVEREHCLSVGIGEDAYFLRSDSLGVADGVGGWSGHAGANPARWSRKLMHHCSAELARYENIEDELFLQYYEIDPVDVLQRAFERSLAECKEEGVIGSSTALLAVLRNDELRLANMGDCCCSIIRGSDYIFRSEEQQHSFNFPVQIGTNSRDTPNKDAQRFTIKVQKDDIVILSSDGLVDNLFDEDILEEVLRFVAHAPPPPTPPPPASPSSPNRPNQRYTLNRFSPQVVSEALCHRAKSVYEDQRAVSSPFQQRAMEEGIHFAGGKRDDVTTLIGIAGELEASADRR